MHLTRSSALGKLGKIKTFTVRGLIKIFSDRLSSCNYSNLKMRLQTRASWLTLKFCFWLFLNKLQEWMQRSRASANSRFVSFFPFLSGRAPRACGFSSGIVLQKDDLKSPWMDQGSHTNTFRPVFVTNFKTGLILYSWLYYSARLRKGWWLNNLGAKLADRELQGALSVRESEPRSLTGEWSIWLLNDLNICFPSQMVSSQALLLLWH